MTAAMKSVLRQLATDEWVMDCYGNDGNQAILLRRQGESRVVSAKTVNRLLSEGFIGSTHADITDFRITKKGREALTPSETPKERGEA